MQSPGPRGPEPEAWGLSLLTPCKVQACGSQVTWPGTPTQTHPDTDTGAQRSRTHRHRLACLGPATQGKKKSYWTGSFSLFNNRPLAQGGERGLLLFSVPGASSAPLPPVARATSPRHTLSLRSGVSRTLPSLDQRHPGLQGSYAARTALSSRLKVLFRPRPPSPPDTVSPPPAPGAPVSSIPALRSLPGTPSSLLSATTQ